MHMLSVSARRVLGVAALVLAVVAGAVGSLAITAYGTAPAGTGAPASVPKCATSKLVIWMDTQGNGAAGSIYYNLRLTNLSGHSCSLDGYPKVAGVNLSGTSLGSPASRDTARTPGMVILASKARAIAVLRIVEAGLYSASTCHQVTAAGLRATPPNQVSSKVVPFPFQACSRKGPLYLSVEAVKKS